MGVGRGERVVKLKSRVKDVLQQGLAPLVTVCIIYRNVSKILSRYSAWSSSREDPGCKFVLVPCSPSLTSVAFLDLIRIFSMLHVISDPNRSSPRRYRCETRRDEPAIDHARHPDPCRGSRRYLALNIKLHLHHAQSDERADRSLRIDVRDGAISSRAARSGQQTTIAGSG